MTISVYLDFNCFTLSNTTWKFLCQPILGTTSDQDMAELYRTFEAEFVKVSLTREVC